MIVAAVRSIDYNLIFFVHVYLFFSSLCGLLVLLVC